MYNFLIAYNSFIPAIPPPTHRFGCIGEVLFPLSKVLIFSHLTKGREDLLLLTWVYISGVLLLLSLSHSKLF